jgi:hypothetical protein
MACDKPIVFQPYVPHPIMILKALLSSTNDFSWKLRLAEEKVRMGDCTSIVSRAVPSAFGSTQTREV